MGLTGYVTTMFSRLRTIFNSFFGLERSASFERSVSERAAFLRQEGWAEEAIAGEIGWMRRLRQEWASEDPAAVEKSDAFLGWYREYQSKLPDVDEKEIDYLLTRAKRERIAKNRQNALIAGDQSLVVACDERILALDHLIADHEKSRKSLDGQS